MQERQAPSEKTHSAKPNQLLEPAGLLQLPSERSMAAGAEVGDSAPTRDNLRGGTRTRDVGVSEDVFSLLCAGAIRRRGHPLERQNQSSRHEKRHRHLLLSYLWCNSVLPSRRDSSASTSQATCCTGQSAVAVRPHPAPEAQLPERYAHLALPGSRPSREVMQRRDLDRGSSVVCFCGRHDRTKADEDPDEGTAAVGSADASSRITSRLGD